MTSDAGELTATNPNYSPHHHQPNNDIKAQRGSGQAACFGVGSNLLGRGGTVIRILRLLGEGTYGRVFLGRRNGPAGGRAAVQEGAHADAVEARRGQRQPAAPSSNPSSCRMHSTSPTALPTRDQQPHPAALSSTPQDMMRPGRSACGRGLAATTTTGSAGSTSSASVGASSAAAEPLVAVKVLPRSSLNRQSLAEVWNQMHLQHPHIIAMDELLITRHHACMVLQLANGGTLLQHLQHLQQPLPEAAARRLFQQLVLAVDFCHKSGFAHRDIKLENLLLHQEPGTAQPLLKLGDFGCSQLRGSRASSTAVGTPSYMAAEVLLSSLSPLQYDARAADVWSCGVVLYALLFGRLPFGGAGSGSQADRLALLGRVAACKYEVPRLPLPASASSLDLLNRLLQPMACKRPRTDDIMRHPWFLQGLPQGALDMNRAYLRVAKARRASALAAAAASARDGESSAAAAAGALLGAVLAGPADAAAAGVGGLAW